MSDNTLFCDGCTVFRTILARPKNKIWISRNYYCYLVYHLEKPDKKNLRKTHQKYKFNKTLC